MISTATHGSVIPGYSFSNVRSRYQIKTLIDVSPTGIISEYRGDVPMPFVDDLKNIINDQESWSNSRNEQRNWETLVQCISIRAQPIMLSEPVVENVSITSLDFGYKGKQVRDNIHSHDLVNMFWQFYLKPRIGEVYNAGGSRHSNCSMLEAINICEELSGREMKWTYEENNRVGDHIWWISDVRKFKSHFPEWEYRYGIREILEEIVEAQMVRK